MTTQAKRVQINARRKRKRADEAARLHPSMFPINRHVLLRKIRNVSHIPGPHYFSVDFDSVEEAKSFRGGKYSWTKFLAVVKRNGESVPKLITMHHGVEQRGVRYFINFTVQGDLGI